jgi:dTDP-4-amino-4,6-dideoxygalactose transaminase
VSAIPFVNLVAQLDRLRPDLESAFKTVLAERAFIQGGYAASFSREFCAELGLPPGIGCSSGTSALIIALAALGVGPGDDVITVANTFFATAEAICALGASPVFVDVEPGAYTMDPDAFEAAITPRTKAVVPVHLFGTPCRMDAISRVAKAHGLAVVEDAAQAHMARYDGKPLGAYSDAVAFSFYPGKNLGALGDAGFVCMADPERLDWACRYLDHGRSSKYEHGFVGSNHRMDGLQAAFLSAKLPYLAEWTERRRANAALYDRLLGEGGIKRIEPDALATPVYHLYVIEADDRTSLQRALDAANIGWGIHYPVPLHQQPAFKNHPAASVRLPVTERAAGRIISLPMCGELTADQVARVCDVVLSALAR